MTINQRGSARIETFLKAKIVLDDGLSKIDCVIRDLSDNGAKIEVAASDVIPEKFTLEIPKKNRAFGAEIRWRYENRLGLRFLGLSDEDRIGEPGQTKIQLRADLIQENTRLKALVLFLADRLRQLGQSVDVSTFDVSLPRHDPPDPVAEPKAVPSPRPGSRTPRARR